MNAKRVRDIMIPITDYAVVDQNASLLEAQHALEAAQERLPPGRAPHRAVLVTNDHGEIVGKLGHLAFLKALDSRWDDVGSPPVPNKFGLSDQFFTPMMGDMSLWERDLGEYARRTRRVQVKRYMHPVHEHVDADASLSHAIHTILTHQTLSLLVTSEGQAVGILRLSDLFAVTTRLIKEEAARPEPAQLGCQ